MPGSDDERLDALHTLDARMHREDPRFADALAAGRACPPREYRHSSAWVLLATALVPLAVGALLGHGLLLTGGLVLAGIAGHLFDSRRTRPRQPGRGPPFR
ncbi:DUF3040 domain-containing protein [Streptomyces meridianus]|uniref:DUF3040 domain-containing protein n=1 Tax=Streptomyces meridianus TaxID=2938945 RepID=A0ABT0XC09_9ACTN|nr:DUF3040 domain-containing protein [Streptomyces meridianus]MCM2580051.1 DUF3040 domain-containing protein [Streptomyces meridianus]